MLKSHAADDLKKFRLNLIKQARDATEEVQSQTDVSQFAEDWEDPRHGELFAIVHKLLAKD